MTALSQELIKLSKSTSGSENLLRPEGLDYLPFQRGGIDYGLKVRHVLLGDEPGLGKTIQAIGILNQLPARPLIIVCPAVVRTNWQRELLKWSIHKDRSLIHKNTGARKGKALGSFSPIITSYNYWNSESKIREVNRDFMEYDLIIDECHYLKNTSSKRTKFLYAKNGLWSRARKVIAVSGTPIVNRPMELYTTVARLAPELIGNKTKWQYGKRYCAGWQTPWGGWNFNGSSNLKELGRNLRSGLMVRREKKKVLKDLPDRFVNVVHLDPSQKAKAKIKTIQTYDQNVKLEGAVTPAFEETSEVRRELGMLKAPLVLDYVVNQLRAGHKKVGIFFHHKEVGEYLLQNLQDFNPSIVKGGQTDLKRTHEIDKFQNQESVRVILCSITAANIGITLTAGSYLCFAELSYVPGENSQAIDRFHRIGQSEPVVADLLVLPKTADEHIVKLLLKKEKSFSEFY